MKLSRTIVVRRRPHPDGDDEYFEALVSADVDLGPVTAVLKPSPGAKSQPRPVELKPHEMRVAIALLRELLARAAGQEPCGAYEPFTWRKP